MATATPTKKRPRGRAVKQASRGELVQTLQKAIIAKGGELSNNDFHRRRFGLYPLGQYEREFGGLAAAMRAAVPDGPISDSATSDKAKDKALTAALEKAAVPARSEFVKGIVTIEKAGVASVVQADDITNVVRMIRFVGDDTTADILMAWTEASGALPTGPSYTYSARAGDTTISLQIV